MENTNIDNIIKLKLYLDKTNKLVKYLMVNRDLIDHFVLYKKSFNKTVNGNENLIKKDILTKFNNLKQNLNKINKLITEKKYIYISDNKDYIQESSFSINEINIDILNLLGEEVILYVKKEDGQRKSIKL